MNKGLVYALWAYEAQNSDELSFHEGDALTILRRKDESETEWWWARLGEREGYVPKNLLGVSVSPPPKGTLTDTSRAWGVGMAARRFILSRTIVPGTQTILHSGAGSREASRLVTQALAPQLFPRIKPRQRTLA